MPQNEKKRQWCPWCPTELFHGEEQCKECLEKDKQKVKVVARLTRSIDRSSSITSGFKG